MIVDLIVTALAGIVTFVGDLFPTINAPGWLSGLAGQVSLVTDNMAGLGQWVPFGAAGQATVLVLAAVVVAVAVKLIRIVASFFTAGGGSAA